MSGRKVSVLSLSSSRSALKCNALKLRGSGIEICALCLFQILQKEQLEILKFIKDLMDLFLSLKGV